MMPFILPLLIIPGRMVRTPTGPLPSPVARISNLTYAKRKELSLSIEGSLFKNRIDFTASFFHIKKDGIPVQTYSLYPDFFLTGFPETSFVPYTNFAANRYQGFDIQINYHKRAGAVNLIIRNRLDIRCNQSAETR